MIRVAKKLFEILDLYELAIATTVPHTSANTALIRYVATVIPFVKIFNIKRNLGYKKGITNKTNYSPNSFISQLYIELF